MIIDGRRTMTMGHLFMGMPSPKDDLQTGASTQHDPKLNIPPNGTNKDAGDNRKGHVVESLSIWPKIAELLKAEQYDQAAELLLQMQLARQPISSEASTAFLVIARAFCQAYQQYQAEIAWYQQALETANLHAGTLSQQLYTMFTSPEEQLMSGKFVEAITPGAVVNKLQADKQQIAKSSTSLEIYCLGLFEVFLNGQPILEWSSLKARSIFKYLVVHPDVPIARDVLMDVFWPDADPEGARHNLHQAIHSLRKTLKQEYLNIQPILFENDAYSLNPELNLWLDYVEFEKQIQGAQRLEKTGCQAEAMAAYRGAVELYRGDFLAEDRYEDWSSLQREYFRQVYIDLVDQLGEYSLQQGELTETIALCQKLLAEDNCHEAAQRRLMRCYLLLGQRHSAIRQYQLCVENLKMELNVPPSPATQLLYTQIMETQQPLKPGLLF
ncbi:MAG: winged helix-turn-helix domain-containing protein [Chloroflexi bacterium]|nr:winged helix-turn-helix domain-containing protein [Chloroflexota bacterium]